MGGCVEELRWKKINILKNKRHCNYCFKSADANTDLLHTHGALRQLRPLRRAAAAALPVSAFLLLRAVLPQQQVEGRHGNAVIDHKLKEVGGVGKNNRQQVLV